jgi:uracil-DNA glycosylase family 4
VRRVGIDLNKDCWKTNVRRCYVEGNPTPTTEEIRNCRPALFKEIKELNPRSILLFGATAAEGVIGHLWKTDGKCPLAKWTNWVIPHQELNAWISVHYHPSYLERKNEKLINLLAHRQLKNALKKTERPWKKPPDFASEVQILYDSSKVASYLKELRTPFAFDYEANCVKPEYKGAEIVSCAFSDGDLTFAFPWHSRPSKGNVKELFQSSKHKKIGCNIKFEERWTRHFLDCSVKGWVWDTMLAAHTLNNARGITSLKFQSFVLLGQSPYDTHIEPYLTTSRNQHINRIRELPIEDVLVYNGMDAILTYKIAKMQKKEMRG